MFTWLQSLPEWEEALFLVIFCLLGFGALAAVFFALIRGGVVFGGEKFRMEVDPKTGEKIRRRKSPHVGCKNVEDIVLVVRRVAEDGDKIYQIKYVEMMREQMTYVENKAIILRGFMSKIFLSALSDALKGDPTQAVNLISHPDYKYYGLVLDKMIDIQVGYMRSSLRSNHYLELSEIEFDKYTTEKIDMMVQITTDLLNAAYEGTVLKRSELYKVNMLNIGDIRAMVYDAFLKARNIAKNCQERIDLIAKERDKFIEDLFGIQL